MIRQSAERIKAGICVSVAGRTLDEAISVARQSEKMADVIEIRLDSLDQPHIRSFIEQIQKPLLFTNRPAWEGGSCTDDENERIAPLLEAIRADAAFVDMELRTAGHLREKILAELNQDSKTRLICSWHNFHGTPADIELKAILAEQVASGAHIGKIVTMAEDYRDVLRVLNLQPLAAEHGFPLIAFCMGGAGMISRIATLLLGGYMTYAAPDAGGGTAPGQLPISAMREILAGLNVAAAIPG